MKGRCLSRPMALIAGAIACIVTPPGVAAQDAQLRLHRIFGDGMVVQRDAPIRVWGWAPAGTEVGVTFDGQSVRTVANAGREFTVDLPARPAGGPYEMVVAAAGARTVIRDILVGDVWVASGQSNMEWPVAQVNNATGEIAAANDPLIRHFAVPHSWSWSREPDIVGGAWTRAEPEHVGAFSAVAYFFARALRTSVDVPIGILNTSWSGSAIAPWMSQQALNLDDDAVAALERTEELYRQSIRDSLLVKVGDLPERDPGLVDGSAVWANPSLDDSGWRSIGIGPWENNGYAGLDGVAWYRAAFTLTDAEARAGARLSLGTIDDADITWVNGVEVGRTNSYSEARLYGIPSSALRPGRNVIAVRVSDGGGNGGIVGGPDRVYIEIGSARRPLDGEWKFGIGAVSLGEDGQRVNRIPTVLYNRMVHPLLPFAIRGAIWYQGESNANNDEQARAYRALFSTMIKSWRASWRSATPDFPFLWVQLPNYGRPDSLPPATAGWAHIRESQSAALSLPNTGQAVIIDIGDPGDIHPRNKQDVGHRLALLARATAYNMDVRASGPMYRGHAVRDGRVIIEFDHVNEGIVVRGGSDTIRGFAIAGADGVFRWANARVDGNRVIVWHDDIASPVAVRYAWSNSPDGLGLYNSDSLPMAPFRTDDW